ncbi:MAG: hypothetical protein KBG15_20345 [Kofleriaceae bacterium]|nr:hypothetical protein [Kofleriaceae bacterium]
MNKHTDDARAFLVPAWLVGSMEQVESTLKQCAREWAKSWQANGTFPDVKLVSPGPRTPLLYNTSDHWPDKRRARLFANVNFVADIVKDLGYLDIKTAAMAYEAHVGGTAWGAFEGLLFERWPNGLESTRRRLERVMPQLPVLAATLVMDYDNVERPAATVIEQQVSATLANWGAPDTAPLAVRIEHTLAEMERSNPQNLRARIVACMLQTLPTVTRLQNREAFTEEQLRASLDVIDASDLAELTGCTRKALVNELYAMDREF